MVICKFIFFFEGVKLELLDDFLKFFYLELFCFKRFCLGKEISLRLFLKKKEEELKEFFNVYVCIFIMIFLL